MMEIFGHFFNLGTFVAFWLFFCVLVGMFAHVRRNTNGLGWFLVAFYFSPLVAFLLLAVLKTKGNLADVNAQTQLLYDAMLPEEKARVDEARAKRKHAEQEAQQAYYHQRRLAVWIILGVMGLIWLFSVNARAGEQTPITKLASMGEPHEIVGKVLTKKQAIGR